MHGQGGGEAASGSFGTQLRALREAAGLSQEELAERAGLSSHAVSALERGTRTRPYPHTVRSLADALAITGDRRAALIAAVPRRRATPDEPSVPSPGRRRVPVPATPLLGRDSELALVAELLRDPDRRLVTLTGTGGVGKTRLSLAVAAAVAADFADGVTYVELAPLLDPEAVLPAIAEAVYPGTTDDHDSTPAILDRLADRQLLLVLDNFEHLLDAAPQIAAVIERAPDLTVLVTSRAALRVRGETEVAVEPLRLPDAAAPTWEGVQAAPAATLLRDRADAVSPGWGSSPSDAAAIADICHRLAGIPLALELAAARCRLLDPAGLLARLDDAWLEGARDLPERQRTMTAALDWSYGLLQPDEQAMLRLLSVFAGGFHLDDVEAVAELSGTCRADDVPRILQSLAEQSLLVRASPAATPGRRHLLEPVAQYARSKLATAGDWESVARAHARHFLELAEEAAPHYQGGQQVTWLERVDAEHANMTVAMDRSLGSGDLESAARFGWALWLYWWLRGHLRHGRRLTEAVLAHDLPTNVRAQAALAAATMAFALDDIPRSHDWWAQALSYAEQGDDEVALANAVAGVGLALLASGDVLGAERRFLETVPISERAGAAGEWTAALNQIWLGTTALATGDPDRAVEHVERGLASARRRGDRLAMYIALYNLSQVEVVRGRHAGARAHLAEGMRLSQETGDHANLAYFLDDLAVLEAADGRHARVPLLFGAAQAIRESIGAHGYGYYRPDVQGGKAAATEARLHLGIDRYDDALDVGRAMSPDEAVSLALADPAAQPA
jgi:predicted ATPase/DNA-binding XRE family transcriptional regulator